MENSPARIRVALLEGDRLLCRFLLERLEAAQCLVVSASREPAEFVARLPSLQPDVALIDMCVPPLRRLPASELLNFLGSLHARHLTLSTLVFSDSEDSGFVERCYQGGVGGYLERETTSPSDVVEAVQRAARGERTFPLQLLAHPLRPAPRPEISPALQSISNREREVLAHLAAGADNLKIAAMLRISERTVKAHVSALYRKLGSENRTQLALTALQLGLRPPAIQP